LQTRHRRNYFKSQEKIKPGFRPGHLLLQIFWWFSAPVPHFLPELLTFFVGHFHPFIFPGPCFLARFGAETPVKPTPFVTGRPVSRASETSEKYFAQNKQAYPLPVANGIEIGGNRQNGVPKPLHDRSEGQSGDQDKDRQCNPESSTSVLRVHHG
jgi:hypothetical protein